jgi:hypothetical protein
MTPAPPDLTDADAIRRWIADNFSPDEGEEILLADGLEKAFLGVGGVFNGPLIAVYDQEAILRLYLDRDGMTPEEASEFFEFNVLGAYVGARTPMFISRFELGGPP